MQSPIGWQRTIVREEGGGGYKEGLKTAKTHGKTLKYRIMHIKIYKVCLTENCLVSRNRKTAPNIMQYHITANPYAPSSNAKDKNLTLSQLFNNKMCQ